MKTKVSPAIVGMFVIGAFALGVIALLTFGGVNFFAKPQRFVVYFDESVQGLTLGSPVKLSGVQVGRVVDLNIRYDGKINRSIVAVVCEFNRDKVTDTKGAAINVADRGELQTLIDRGLRAQLVVQGLATGLLFVELEFYNPKDYPAGDVRTELKYITVPSIQSTIQGFQTSASEILANLKKVDFAGLSRELTGLVADTRKQLDGVDFRGVVEQWKKTGVQVEALAGSADVKRTFESLNGAVVDLRATIAKLDAQIEPAGGELKETLDEAKKTFQAFNETADAARKFIAMHAGVGDDVVATMEHLNEAADAVNRLADFLERNPNALLTGKKRPQ